MFVFMSVSCAATAELHSFLLFWASTRRCFYLSAAFLVAPVFSSFGVILGIRLRVGGVLIVDNHSHGQAENSLTKKCSSFFSGVFFLRSSHTIQVPHPAPSDIISKISFNSP